MIAAVPGTGAKAALVHPPTLAATAEAIRDALAANGTDTHLLEVPDAEDGKSLQVLGFCWDVFGQIGLGRTDVVIGLGGERSPTWPASPRRPGCAECG